MLVWPRLVHRHFVQLEFLNTLSIAGAAEFRLLQVDLGCHLAMVPLGVQAGDRLVFVDQAVVGMEIPAPVGVTDQGPTVLVVIDLVAVERKALGPADEAPVEVLRATLVAEALPGAAESGDRLREPLGSSLLHSVHVCLLLAERVLRQTWVLSHTEFQGLLYTTYIIKVNRHGDSPSCYTVAMNEPLAAQLRPHALDDFVGQSHLVGEGKPLRVAIEKKHLFSFILWGPPGVGKTTLARLYAKSLGTEFFELSAVSAGKDDIRKIVEKDTESKKILFLDEIHRFTKAQQDFLLPYVESGALTLIGATTENPSFEVISALLSRLRVFTLHELTDEEMKSIIVRAKLKIPKDAMEWLIAMSQGDARTALTTLEATKNLYTDITEENLKSAVQSKFLRYDKKGEDHYNIISAFIKSMRAGDADAAMYYLARMVDAGEDPKFIARRMVIFASEDVGLAQPTALVVANAVFRAAETIGYPECAISLAHGVAYLAQSKKNRSAYDALRAAQADIKTHGSLPVPLKLRNAPTKFMKDEGYGEGYEMYDEGSLLPDKLKNKKYLMD